MEPGRVQAWGVADVVQPGGGGHQILGVAKERGEGARGGGDPLGVRPAAGQ